MSASTMRAVRCIDGGIRVVDEPRPRDGGVRVRVKAVGICGSDLHMMDHAPGLPSIPGHEIAGELDDGTPVAIEPLDPCGKCDECGRGDYQLCRSGPSMIYGVMRNGGMAEEVRVAERCIVPLARGLGADRACLVEPVAVAVHGARKVGLRPDQRVAVIGGGSIGQCAVFVAAAGGCDVGLVARHDGQRACGERLGAREADGEYDVVFDCAGTTSSLERSAELARPGASLVLLASFWDGMEVPGHPIIAKEITIVPSAMYGRDAAGRDVDLAAVLLASHPDAADAMITHRFPLEAAPEAFETARDRKSGSIKVVLEP